MGQTKKSTPGSERGPFPKPPPQMPTSTPRPPRARTDAQRAVGPGRMAHLNSRNQGYLEGNRTGRSVGEAVGRAEGMRTGTRRGRVGGALMATAATGAASMIADKVKKTQSENAKMKSFEAGKVAGRQTTSTGAKADKSTYTAPMTKSLMADGAKPVIKPK